MHQKLQDTIRTPMWEGIIGTNFKKIREEIFLKTSIINTDGTIQFNYFKTL